MPLLTAERLIYEDKIEEALESLQKAITFFRPSHSYVMVGCLKEMIKESEEAQKFFAQAQNLSSEDRLPVQKVTGIFKLNLLERTLFKLKSDKNPGKSCCSHLLGSIYEAENKILKLLKYNQVLELAKKQGEKP